MKKTLMVFFGTCVLLSGCAVVPVAPRPVVAYQPAAAPVVIEQLDYTGEGTPMQVVAYPGVAFYPRCIGLCVTYEDAILIGFVGGYWINGHTGAHVVHEGPWRVPPAHIIARHREFMSRNPNAFHRMPASHVRPGAPAPQHVPSQHAQQHQPQVAPGHGTVTHDASQHQQVPHPQAKQPVKPPQARPAAKPQQQQAKSQPAQKAPAKVAAKCPKDEHEKKKC